MVAAAAEAAVRGGSRCATGALVLRRWVAGADGLYMRSDIGPDQAGCPQPGTSDAGPGRQAQPIRARPSREPTPEAVMGQAGTENFPVAPWFLPRRTRRHLLAVYGYARLVDDVGDETAGDPLPLLDEIEAQVLRLYDPGAAPPEHPLIQRLGATVIA